MCKISCFFSDINECLNGNGNCTQLCTNTIGSYSCSCANGYLMQADGRTCIGKLIIILINVEYILKQFPDINECATSNGNCTQVCTNTVGSYYCSCMTGYTLNSNGQTCDGRFFYMTAAIMVSLLQTLMNA